MRATSNIAVWIDTDPSIGMLFREVDDALALLIAFHSPEISIAGISTTYGNASLKATTRIARDLVARFGQSAGLNEAHVFPGARSRKDLGQQTAASDALASILRTQKLTYLALAPLTNVATFLRLHPDLAPQIERIVIVGGQTAAARLSLGRGGWLRIHDANVFKDAAAVKQILQSDCPISLAPIETSIALTITSEQLKKMRGTSVGDFLHHRCRIWSWFWREIVRLKGGPVFDALAVLAVVRPDLLVCEERFASMHERQLIAREAPAPGTSAVAFYSGMSAGALEFMRHRLTTQ